MSRSNHRITYGNVNTSKSITSFYKKKGKSNSTRKNKSFKLDNVSDQETLSKILFDLDQTIDRVKAFRGKLHKQNTSLKNFLSGRRKYSKIKQS